MSDRPALGSETINGISTDKDANGNPIVTPVYMDPDGTIRIVLVS